MTKEQKYEALLTRAYISGAIGIALAIIAVLFTLFVGAASKAVLGHLPEWVIWTAIFFAVSSIAPLLAAIRCKLASVKLMREIADEP